MKYLLQSRAFRTCIVEEAHDIALTHYWAVDYAEMPPTERLNAIKPVLSRLDRFIMNAAAHAIVGQSATTIDLAGFVASGVPVFINANAAVVGRETAALLDAVLLNTLNDLICERAQPARQVMVVVDEFTHAPGLWDEYLPRIRKEHGCYVITAQGRGSIERARPGLGAIVLQNTDTHVYFRAPETGEAGDAAGMLKNRVTGEDVQRLGLRECYVQSTDGAHPLEPVFTTLAPPPRAYPASYHLIAESSARRYGRPVDAVMARRESWMQDLYDTIVAERKRRPRAARRTNGQATGDDPATAGDDAESAAGQERARRAAEERAREQREREAEERAREAERAQAAMAAGQPPFSSVPQQGLSVVRSATGTRGTSSVRPSRPSRREKQRLKRAARKADSADEPVAVQLGLLGDAPDGS